MRSSKGMNLNELGVTLLTLYMLTAFIFTAHRINSLTVQLIILSIILFIVLLKNIVPNVKILVRGSDIFIIFSIFATIASIHGTTYSISEIAGPAILILGLIISFFIRGSIVTYEKSIKLIFYGSTFYALSVIFSYVLPNVYTSIISKLFRPEVVAEILQVMQLGYYTGFTSQVAYTAGFIVNGIGIIVCLWLVKGYKLSKMQFIILLLMSVSLLLTQKRGHILFLIITILIVYVIYTRTHEKIKSVGKSIIYIPIFVLMGIFLFIVPGLGQSLFSRIVLTIEKFLAGEDISSGRFKLYNYAFELFQQYPFKGIGWGNFKESIIGVVTVKTELQVHNIYLQLLAETGLLGTLFILMPFLLTYIYTIRVVKYVSKNRDSVTKNQKLLSTFSLFIQTFFLLYGLTGNPLYDYSYLMMYFIASGMIYSLGTKKMLL